MCIYAQCLLVVHATEGHAGPQRNRCENVGQSATDSPTDSAEAETGLGAFEASLRSGDKAWGKRQQVDQVTKLIPIQSIHSINPYIDIYI